MAPSSRVKFSKENVMEYTGTLHTQKNIWQLNLAQYQLINHVCIGL